MRSERGIIQSWLRRHLAARGRGANRALASHLGVRPDAITRMVADQAGKEARAVSAEELLLMAEFFGEDAPLAKERQSIIPIMGRIGAGGDISPDMEQVPEGGLERVELPFSMPAEMIGFEVSGDSMRPAYDDRDVVVCFVQQRRAVEFYLGKEVAVRTAEGKRYLKRLSRGPTARTFNLESWNAKTLIGERIEWIGEIVATVTAEGVRHLQPDGGAKP